jgi:hypothetical protein
VTRDWGAKSWEMVSDESPAWLQVYSDVMLSSGGRILNQILRSI